MQIRRRFLVLISAGAFLLTAAAFAQDSDSQSLGDLARQQRQQHAKAVQAKDGKTPKVFTNADLPSRSDDASHSDGSASDGSAAEGSDTGKAPLPVPSGGPKQGSEHLRSEIQAQKNQIAELQRQIDDVNGSIRFAPGNCVRGCEKWNEHQQQKQQQVEQMQAQLEEQKRQLEEMQESARKQGFGSSVYDP
jgi:hypothetical protein